MCCSARCEGQSGRHSHLNELSAAVRPGRAHHACQLPLRCQLPRRSCPAQQVPDILLSMQGPHYLRKDCASQSTEPLGHILMHSW